MRIYGGHDYYDCGLRLGIDKTVTLVRSKDNLLPDEFQFLVQPPYGGIWLQHSNPNTRQNRYDHQEFINGVSIQMRVVVFCNKYYLGAEVHETFYNTNQPSRESVVWSAEKLRELLSKHELIPVVSPDASQRWGRTFEERVDDFFVPKAVNKSLLDCMIANRYSILVLNKDKGRQKATVSVNPFNLKSLEFAKALDPYTAFQELSMWVGGVLGGYSPEIVSIKDDKVLLENHGYDKFSFRSQERP